MWLLDTTTLDLRAFVSPETVEEGYVILSHVWDSEEQSFHDLRRIRDVCALSGDNPHHYLSPKIRNFCSIAQTEGYRWAWIDTCCIDKSSSAELSEAINSMYRYYSLALACYAYLQDVPLDEPGTAFKSSFQFSKWHTRGWTLQELIAPRVVHFFSEHWHHLGSKDDLAERLTDITGIPETVLRLKQKPADISIARRMAWAAGRRTTRIEDEAYCLLGLFDINMPTLYGEGRKAFRRLQEELLRHSSDTTLFAWGDCRALHDREWHPPLSGESEDDLAVFASSPSSFSSFGIEFVHYLTNGVAQGTSSVNTAMTRMRFMTFNVTSRGVLAHLPIVEINGQPFTDLGWVSRVNVPQYVIGRRLYTTDPQPARLLMIWMNTAHHNFSCPTISDWESLRHRCQWKDVCLVFPSRPATPEPSYQLYISSNHSAFSAPLRIPEPIAADLATALGADETTTSRLSKPWLCSASNAMVFRNVQHPQLPSGHVVLRYGRCTRMQPPAIWVTMELRSRNATDSEERREEDVTGSDPDAGSTHRCSAEHVLTWPGLKRQFVLWGSHNLGLGWTDWYTTCTLTFDRSSETGCLTLADMDVRHFEADEATAAFLACI
ncbi:heterokaryon incompatibility protein-domain-containing protein [Daedaleopsis nitida]|nr:heterokaryon incompatibility protein-domain-containing protein [Daedaleopsis nitida]